MAHAVADLAVRAVRGVDGGEAPSELTTCDVRRALRPVCESTDGVDGRVSIEVGPGSPHDTAPTRSRLRRGGEVRPLGNGFSPTTPARGPG